MYWLNKVTSARNLRTALLAITFEWLVLSKLHWALFSHPVSVFTRFIEWLIKTKHKHSNFYGFVLNFVFTLVSAFLGYGLHYVLRSNLVGQAFEIIIVASLFAHSCLLKHVNNILDWVYSTEFSFSRQALAMIVGRDINNANEHEVCATAILSLIENFCDATFSPLLYYLVFNLPGLLVYKTVELADSVYGNHKLENRVIGKWIAIYDDVLNYIPARLLGLLFLVVLYTLNLGKYDFVMAYNDGYSLVSVNNALSEAAVALHLNIKLNGSRYYNSLLTEDRQFNVNGRLANGLDIKSTQYVINVVLLLVMIILSALLFLLS